MNTYQIAPNQYDLTAIRRLLPRQFSDEETLLFLCYDYFLPVYQQFQPDMPLSDKFALLLDYCAREQQFAILLPLLCDLNPNFYLEYDPAFRQIAARYQQSFTKLRFFISYKTDIPTDQHLATYLYHFLTKLGHEVYLDQTWSSNPSNLAEIDQRLKESHLMIALISEFSVDSELLRLEMSHAHEYQQRQGQPRIFVIRVNYEDLFPYSLDLALRQAQVFTWQHPTDHERIGLELLAALERPLPNPLSPPPRPVSRRRTITQETVIAEDGQLLNHENIISPPLPEFDPRFLEIPSKQFNPQELSAPGGAVRLRDKFYIERKPDPLLKAELSPKKGGTTVTIRAARQMGKSSLLVRGIHEARQQEANVIYIDLQGIDRYYLQSFDYFLRHLAESMLRQLRLKSQQLESSWQSSLGAKEKLTYFIEDEIFPRLTQPLVLALDEVDLLLQPHNGNFHTDFFSLLRSWHNSRASDISGQWDKLSILMSISTEPYLLIQDNHQSPFNVGLNLTLEDFTDKQVFELNWKHGEPVQAKDFKNFYALLNGHPYLTRKALYTMVTEGMTWPQLAKMATDDNGPFSDHLLRNYWLLVNDSHGLDQALREVIRRNSYDNESAILRLLKAGLIRGSGKQYQCRCELYTRYFEGKL